MSPWIWHQHLVVYGRNADNLNWYKLSKRNDTTASHISDKLLNWGSFLSKIFEALWDFEDSDVEDKTLRTGYFEDGRLWEQDGWGERWRVANNRMPSIFSCSQNNVIYLLIVCTVILCFIVGLYYSLLVNRCSLLVFQKYGTRFGGNERVVLPWIVTDERSHDALCRIMSSVLREQCEIGC